MHGAFLSLLSPCHCTPLRFIPRALSGKSNLNQLYISPLSYYSDSSHTTAYDTLDTTIDLVNIEAEALRRAGNDLRELYVRFCESVLFELEQRETCSDVSSESAAYTSPLATLCDSSEQERNQYDEVKVLRESQEL